MQEGNCGGSLVAYQSVVLRSWLQIRQKVDCQFLVGYHLGRWMYNMYCTLWGGTKAEKYKKDFSIYTVYVAYSILEHVFFYWVRLFNVHFTHWWQYCTMYKCMYVQLSCTYLYTTMYVSTVFHQYFFVYFSFESLTCTYFGISKCFHLFSPIKIFPFFYRKECTKKGEGHSNDNFYMISALQWWNPPGVLPTDVLDWSFFCYFSDMSAWLSSVYCHGLTHR